MPRTTLTLQVTKRATNGLLATYSQVDQANGSDFDNSNQDVILHIKNAHTASVTATITTPETRDTADAALAVADLTWVVANATERFLGPFPRTPYNQDDGKIFIDYDITNAGITIAAIQIGNL